MNYTLKRTGQAVLTLYVALSLSFAIIRFIPGGPYATLRARLRQQGSGLSAEQVNRQIEAMTNIAANKPLHIQYLDYLTSILHGDMGQSIWHNKPVSSILFEALPWTLLIMGCSLVLMFILGIGLGAFMAYREGSSFDVFSSVGTLVMNSTPYYVVALLLLTFLGYRYEWFPTRGRVGSGVTAGANLDYLVSVLRHAALPIISLVVTGFGGWALRMRGNSIRVLGEDYLRVARLRGLPEGLIVRRYVGRNAILPLYTNFMIAIGTIFGGSIILEMIFSYPGIGYYMIRAIDHRDYPVVMGGFIIITTAMIVGITIADFTYGFVDPRVKQGESRESY